MRSDRIRQLQIVLDYPILIKKKENLLYLTGRSFMHGFLLVLPGVARIKSVKNHYGKLHGKAVFFGDGLERAEGIMTDRLKFIGKHLDGHGVLQLEDEFTFAEFSYIRGVCRGGPWPARAQSSVKIKHVKSPVDFQRIIKDNQEIAVIRNSMQIVEKVFNLVRREIKKPGMTEIKLADFIKTAGLRLGAQDISFPPIVAGGANAATPHHVPSNKKLKAGEAVILDFGFKYKNYCSDFTRTVFLKKVDRKMAAVYNQVEKAYKGAINFIDDCKGGAPVRRSFSEVGCSAPTGADVYRKAVDVLKEKHLDQYFIHSLGHGTGLEIHEMPNLSPYSKENLQEGMVFSIEPGVYLPKKGGVRIEDLVYFKKGGIKRFIAVPTAIEDNVLG